MKKSEAELANLRVQLQAQLLNEKALEAQLESRRDPIKARGRPRQALLKAQLGAEMNAKISRAKADSLVTAWKSNAKNWASPRRHGRRS